MTSGRAYSLNVMEEMLNKLFFAWETKLNEI